MLSKEKIEYLWKDNGFSSLHNMDMAHYPIVQFITDTVLPLFPKSNDPLHVIDFGCGNGELLFKLQHCDTNSLKLYGVDISEEKIIRADKRMGKSGLFEIGNIFPIDGHLKLLPPEKSKYDIAIFMPGRILDHSGIDAENTLRQLRHIATYIVIYAYGDWTSGFTIEKLLNKVGWDSVDIQLNDTKVVGLLK